MSQQLVNLPVTTPHSGRSGRNRSYISILMVIAWVVMTVIGTQRASAQTVINAPCGQTINYESSDPVTIVLQPCTYPRLNINSSSGGPVLVEGNGAVIDHAGSYGSTAVNFGLALAPQQPITLRNMTFTGGNTTANGGGISIAGVVVMERVTVTGNQAGVVGGGIYVKPVDSDITIIDSTISNNRGSLGGGLGWIITSNGSAHIKFIRSTINGNGSYRSSPTQGGGGGGVYLRWETIQPSLFAVENSTVSGNTAETNGGGLYFKGQMNARITDSTLTGNDALFDGGALYDGPIFTNDNSLPLIELRRNIIAGNGARDCGYTIGDYSLDYGYNLLGSTCHGAFLSPTSTIVAASALGLGPLADNGGPTKTHLPSAISPARNMIPVGVNGCGSNPATDQRGVPRPQGAKCDIGAVEVEVDGNTAPSISAATIARTAGNSGSNSLISTVEDADDAENTLSVTVNGAAGATVNGVTVNGVSVNAAGQVTANVVAACAGTNASFTLRVTDSGGMLAEATLNVTVTNNPQPSLGSYPGATVTAGGSTTVTPSSAPGDNVSISGVTVTAPGFTGLATVNPSSGVVSLSNAGPVGGFTIAVTATDNCGAQTTRTFTLTVACSSITLGALPNGNVGVSYNQSISVAPAGAYSFSLTQGSLPPGLTLNSSTGSLSGLPSVTGTYSFTVRAANAGGCANTRAYSLMVSCPNITLSALPTPALNAFYNQTLAASPSAGSYRFAITAGALPTGLSLNGGTGLISGTPAAAGAYSFTITATASGACSGSRTYSGTIISVCAMLSLPNIANGYWAQMYSQSVTASPAASYTYTYTGVLPPGVIFYTSAGLIYGYPTKVGIYNFTVTATDANGCQISKSYSLMIN
ncbi:MAG: putative Ig domain-containing protein [Acidobacteriota bacterium]